MRRATGPSRYGDVMPRRRIVVAALVATLALAGCTPSPEPTPSPTGFASEEEAFAAAEATYRAYVDAGNTLRSDPSADVDPSDYLTGKALSAELESRAAIENSGRHLDGLIEIQSVHPIRGDLSTALIGVCLDVSATRVLDDSGLDVTPSDRPSLLGLEIEATWASPRPLLTSTSASDAQC